MSNENPLYVNEVLDEFNRAQKRFGSFASAHEGYAVILEELDELWLEIRTTKWDKIGIPDEKYDSIRKEAIQTAAMVLRFLHDIMPTPVNPYK